MKFGEKLRRLRKAQKLTQQELAEIVKVHLNTVSRWENLEEPIDDLTKLTELAQVLNTTIEYLRNNDEQPVEINITQNENKTIDDDLKFEWGNGQKLHLPNTPENRAMLERIVLAAISGQNTQVGAV